MLSHEDYLSMTRLDDNLSSDDLDKLLADAETDVDTMTLNRITAHGLDRFTEFQIGKIKSAIAHQADFRRKYAELLSNPLQSYSINGVSMSWDKSVIRTECGVQTNRQVVSLLMQTGLMYRGVIG